METVSPRVYRPEYIPPPTGRGSGAPAYTNDASAPPGACLRCGGADARIPAVQSIKRTERAAITRVHGKVCLPCGAELAAVAAAELATSAPWAATVAELVASLGRSLYESTFATKPRRTAPKRVKAVISSRDPGGAPRRKPTPRKGGT